MNCGVWRGLWNRLYVTTLLFSTKRGLWKNVDIALIKRFRLEGVTWQGLGSEF